MSFACGQSPQVEEGYRLLKDGKFNDAADFFIEITRNHPENAPGWAGLGNALDGAGDHPGARDAYEKSLGLDQDQPEIWFYLGNLYYRQKNLADAITAYRSAVQFRSDYAEAHNNLGAVFRDMGRYEEALDHFTTATSLNPDYALAHRNGGDILLRQENYSEAVAWLRRATEVDPENLYGWYWLGRAHLKMGKPKEAIPLFLKVLASRPDLAPVHHDLGLAYFSQRDYGPAVEHVRTAIGQNPASAPYWVTLARIYSDLNWEEQALAVLEDGLNQHGEVSTLYLETGDIHKSAGRFTEALNAYSRAADLEPDSWQAHYKKGVILYYLRKLDESEASLAEAVTHNPEASSIYLFQGLVALSENRSGLAEARFLKAASLDSSSVDIWLHLGQAQTRQRKWKDALENLERALVLNPNSSQVLYRLAEVHKKLGNRLKAGEYQRRFKQASDFEAKVNTLEKRLTADPLDTRIRRELADFYEQRGELSKSLVYLKQAWYLGDEIASEELNRITRKMESEGLE